MCYYLLVITNQTLCIRLDFNVNLIISSMVHFYFYDYYNFSESKELSKNAVLFFIQV